MIILTIVILIGLYFVYKKVGLNYGALIGLIIGLIIGSSLGIAGGGTAIAGTPIFGAIGSITKMFTATIIMHLYDSGQLDLEDNISNYLDNDIVDKVENVSTTKIKNLLNHTSGITDFETDGFLLEVINNPNKHWTAEENLTYAYNQSADFAMGTKVSYSNTNYLLLGLIAEQITGKSGAQLYNEIIVAPLGLTATTFNQNSDITSNIVRGYMDDFGNLKIRDVTEITYAHNSMEGGISSTAYDLNLFMKGILTPNIVLSDNSIQKMQEWTTVPYLYEDDYPQDWNVKMKEINQGLGWAEYETSYGNAIGHNGSIIGYSANMLYFPNSNIYVSYLINGSGGKIDEIVFKDIELKEIVELLFE